MASQNFYNPSPGPLFPAARGMKQTITTLATGLVPGVNTLISPMAKQGVVATVPDSPMRGGRIKATVPPHALTEEEILQQKAFAARLLGAPPEVSVGLSVQNVGVNGASMITTSQVGSRLALSSMASVVPTPRAVAVGTPQHVHGGPRYPNQRQNQQQQLLDQSRVNTGGVVGSLNTPPQQQFLPKQQQQFGHQTQPFIPQDQQNRPQLSQQQGLQNLNAPFTAGRPNNANPGPRWPGNAGKGNQTVVGSVRGAFGKSPSRFPSRPTDGAVNKGPGILGAYPTAQKFGMPVRNPTPQTSQFSPQPTPTPITTTYTTPSTSMSTVSSTPPSAVQPSIQLQPNFRDTLQGLTSYESESLRKALLSGKMESLGLTSAQALDILQTLKSISSVKTDRSDGNWTDSVSTNWPGTADDDAKSHSQVGQTADRHRGLGSILESLRSEYSTAKEAKQEPASKRWDNMMPKGSYQDQSMHMQAQAGPNQAGLFATGAGGKKNQGKENRTTRWDVPGFIPGDISNNSQPITEHVISSINENLEILQMQREKLVQSQTSFPGQSGDDRGKGAMPKRSNENNRRSRSRERHDNRDGGDRSGRSDPKYSDRDRDRHGYRDRDRGRDDRGERRRSRENEQRRSPGRHRNTPPSRNRSRSRSRERKDPGRRSTSWERRERRHPSNDRQDSSSQRRRGDSPDAKRRRPNQREDSLWRGSSSRVNQGVRTPAWYQRKKDAMWNRKPKTEEKSVPPSGSKPSLEGDRKPQDAPSQPPIPKPIPLLNIVIPRKGFRAEGNSSARKPAPAPTAKPSTDSSARKPVPAPTAKPSTEPPSTKASATTPTSSGDPKPKTTNPEEKPKYRKEETKLTVKEASQAAAAMSETPLLEKLGESSIQHQLDLLKEIGLEDNIKDKEIVDWYCYICGKICNVWSIYLSHVEGRRHKALFRRLHEVGHASLKKTLIDKLAELPDKGKGDPERQNTIRQPSFANMPPPVSSVNSTPLNDKGQAFFCGKCFRTYICSYEEHLLSPDHKRYAEKIRPKCNLCNLTFFNLKALKTHCSMLAHIRKAQESGEDTTLFDGNEAVFDSEEEEDEGAELKTGKGGAKEKEKLASVQMTDISGSEFITPITGFFCKLCSKFYNKEKTAKMVHCRTPAHKLKVKQYYEKRIKSSVASLKSTPGISFNEESPSSATTAAAKNSSKQDGAPKKDVPPKDTPSKEATPKDAPPKDAPHKDAPSKEATPKDSSLKDTPTKHVPTKDVVPKNAPSKADLDKNAPPKDILSTKYATPKNGPAKKPPSKNVPSYNGPPKNTQPKKDTPQARILLLTKDNMPVKDAASDRTGGRQGTTPQGAAKADLRSSPKTDVPKPLLETSPKEMPPPRIASSKLVLSIPKMSTSAIAAINGPSRKDLNSSSAMPKVTTPKVTTPIATTPKVTTPIATTPKAITPIATTPVATTPVVTTPIVTTPKADTSKSVTPKPIKTSIVDTYRSRRAAVNTSTVAKTEVTPCAKPEEKPTTKPEASLTTAKGIREESGTPEKQPKKDGSVEEETRQAVEEDDEWMGEVPDFDNMIFVDEVGESDEDDILLDSENEEFDIDGDEDIDEDEF